MSGQGQPHLPEIGFYYPNPMWSDGDWIKNLILFFDGIALLVPEYKQKRIERFDSAIVTGLKNEGLFHIISPEAAVDKSATEVLASSLTDIIASGSLDPLAETSVEFQELSNSRLGYNGDRELAEMIFVELKKRGLARDSEDGVSIPMHPFVRSLVLTLQSQILRPYGVTKGMALNPVTDQPRVVAALNDLLSLPIAPTTGDVVSFDLNAVGIDLSRVPIDEILSFRREHGPEFAKYRRSLRLFAFEIGRMPMEERALAFEDRQATLDESAAALKRVTRRAWKGPASFALGLSGAAVTLISGNPLGAILSGLGAAVGIKAAENADLGAFSYLFAAKNRYNY